VSGHPGGAPVVTAALMVHLYPGVPVRVRLHPKEDRVVIGIGTDPLLLDLFCDRGELVALRDILTAAVADLDTAQDAAPDTDQQGPATEGGVIATAANEVDASAA
jgi:hypothetical protein